MTSLERHASHYGEGKFTLKPLDTGRALQSTTY
jgi:hypothetical protein